MGAKVNITVFLCAKLDPKDLDLDLQQYSLDRKKIIQILDLSLDPNALFIQIFQILRTKFQIFWIFRGKNQDIQHFQCKILIFQVQGSRSSTKGAKLDMLPHQNFGNQEEKFLIMAQWDVAPSSHQICPMHKHINGGTFGYFLCLKRNVNRLSTL